MSWGAGDEEYDVFVLRHGRRHRSAEEYEGRRQVFQENKLKVLEWNGRSDAHKYALPSSTSSHGCIASRHSVNLKC